jgi:hypothetical protein
VIASVGGGAAPTTLRLVSGANNACGERDRLLPQHVFATFPRRCEGLSRRAKNTFLDEALSAAGVPVFLFAVKRTYSMPEIRRVLFQQPAPTQKA